MNKIDICYVKYNAYKEQEITSFEPYDKSWEKFKVVHSKFTNSACTCMSFAC
jgi:hypothetical protein